MHPRLTDSLMTQTDTPETQSELRQRAIRLLARREHTRAELLRKLGPHGDEADVARVIAQLGALDLQSDERFAQSWLRSNAARHGTASLRHRLQQKGVTPELITDTLSHAEIDDDKTRAQALWQRKFGSAPSSRAEWGKQARFLQSRGFASDTIRRIIPAIAAPTEAFADE
jgi:regulatory protein